MNEVPLYSSESAEVTSQKFTFQNTTYAIRQIVSVSVADFRDFRLSARIIAFLISWIILAALAFLLHELHILTADPALFIMIIVTPLVSLFPAIFLFRARTKYVLIIDTASGKIRVMISEDRKAISAIHQALTRALTEFKN